MAPQVCTLYFKPPGDILSVNKNFELAFGYTTHEIAGKTIESIIPESQRGLYSIMLQGFLKGGSPTMEDILSSIVQLQHKDGETINVRLDAKEHLAGDQRLYIVQIELAECNSCTITFDMTGSIIGGSERQHALFGYSEKELKFLRVSDLVPTLVPDSRRGAEQAKDWRWLLDSQAWQDLSDRQMIGRHKEGYTFPLRVQMGSFGGGDNTIFCATLFRISEMAQAFFRVNFEGNIVDCNDQVHDIFGFTREELIGNHISLLMPPEDKLGRKRCRNTLDWHSAYSEDIIRVVTKCGALIYVNCSCWTVKGTSNTGQDEYLIRFYMNENQSEDKIGPYILGPTIAQGAYGVVRVATHCKTKEKVAAKSIKKEAVEEKISLWREMEILRNLNHPNIIKLWDAFETQDKIHIVTELIEGKSLKEIVLGKQLTMEQVRHLFRQIVAAIHYCHQNNVFHRDIKPSNVLVTPDDRVKVIDFGLSNIEKVDKKLQSTFCGSPAFAPPEIILGRKYCGKQADIWSLGVLLYSMLTSTLPFCSLRDVLDPHINFPDYFSEDCKDLLRNMLQGDASKRLTIEQVWAHPWLNPRTPEEAK